MEQRELSDLPPSLFKRKLAVSMGLDINKEALRDALIKSFLVVFTNEKSAHLLLNEHIVATMFSCLEHCDKISLEAKLNLTKLMAIVFKFP